MNRYKSNICQVRVFFCLIIACTSCNTKNEINNKIIKQVNVSYPNGVQDYELLSNIADSCKVIPLETDENCLIGKINKISFFDNKIFISDKSTRTVSVFKDNGEFINRIRNIGRGPGEYMSIDDFFINRKDSSLNVWDISTKRIISMNLDGEHINSKRITDVWTREIMPFNDHYYGYNFSDNGESAPNGLFLINSELDFEKFIYKSTKKNNVYSDNNSMHKISEDLHSICLRNELSILNIRGLKEELLLKYQFKGLKTFDDVKKDVINDKDIDLSIFAFRDNESLNIIDWRNHKENSGFTTIYNKLSGELNVVNFIIDDFIHINGRKVAFEGMSNVFVEIIDAIQVDHYKEHNEGKVEIDHKLLLVDKNDNPIIKIIFVKNEV